MSKCLADVKWFGQVVPTYVLVRWVKPQRHSVGASLEAHCTEGADASGFGIL